MSNIDTEKVKIRFEAEFLEGVWAVNVWVPVEGREDCVGRMQTACAQLAREMIVEAGGGAEIRDRERERRLNGQQGEGK